MESKIVYQMNDADLKKALQDTLSELNQELFYARYEGITVTGQTACEILQISRATLHRYINAGIITPEDKLKNEMIKFRLSYLLKIDIKMLKKQIRYGVESKHK